MFNQKLTTHCPNCHRVIDASDEICPYCNFNLTHYYNKQLRQSNNILKQISTTKAGYWICIEVSAPLIFALLVLGPISARNTIQLTPVGVNFVTALLLSFLGTLAYKDYFWTYILHKRYASKWNIFANFYFVIVLLILTIIVYFILTFLFLLK